MNLDEAIEILDEEPITCEPGRKPELEQALKLGIEALIRERNNRINPGAYAGILLPGETED